ncbi:MAG: hypothetical protein AAGE65_00945 [Planctomycetota bacterium]
MHMPTITLAAGAALIAAGVGLGWISGPADADASFMAKYSKYIPAVFGVLLAVCGVVAFKASARKHAIHVALLFAVLGILGGGARIPKTLANEGSAVALTSQFALLLICAAYLAVGIKSFVAARKARKQLKAAGVSTDAASTPAP